jgi:iron complex outermembrane receptor protein
MQQSLKIRSVLLAGVGLSLCAFPAVAEAPAAAPRPQATPSMDAGLPASGDIVVTARRREEKLQDVPVAVSVVTGAQLQRQNIQTINDFTRSIPSMTITPVNGRGGSASIAIRGQRQTESVITLDPSVQTYINEVNSARPGALNSALFDIDSVQVLKGPQGTLFGRNSTGGALLVTTKKPGDQFGGYIQAYVEDPIATGVTAAVDIPLADGVAVRVAGNYQWRQGYTKVVNLDQHMDDRNRGAGRVTLDLKPVTGLRSTFVADYYRARENGIAVFPYDYIPGGAGSAAITGLVIGTGYPAAYANQSTLGFHETTASSPGISNMDAAGVSNTTSWDVSDSITLKNIAGWRYSKSRDVVDTDGTSANVITTDGYTKQNQYSEEFQVLGKSLDDKLEWVAGGYWFQEKGYDNVHTYTFKAPLIGSYTNNYFDAKNSSYSGFAHASYTLPFFADRTRIYGGLRWTHDKREIVFKNRSVAATGVIKCSVTNAPADCALPASVGFNKVTWDVGIDHKFGDHVLGYFTASTGYRAGGFNGRAQTPAQEVPFRPETVMNYEVGLKNNFMLGGARVTIDAAAYWSKYKDIQRTIVINFAQPGQPAVVGTNEVNAAAATIKGVEFEMSAQITRDFEAHAHYSYTHARYNSFPVFSPVTGTEIDASGNLFYGIPANQAGAGFSWVALDTDTGRWRLDGDVVYSDGFELNDLNQPGGRADASTVVNASISWEKVLGTGITATLYAKNLFNQKYITSGLLLTTSLDVSDVYHGDPRVVGLSLNVPFGAGR